MSCATFQCAMISQPMKHVAFVLVMELAICQTIVPVIPDIQEINVMNPFALEYLQTIQDVAQIMGNVFLLITASVILVGLVTPVLLHCVLGFQRIKHAVLVLDTVFVLLLMCVIAATSGLVPIALFPLVLVYLPMKELFAMGTVSVWRLINAIAQGGRLVHSVALLLNQLALELSPLRLMFALAMVAVLVQIRVHAKLVGVVHSARQKCVHQGQPM